MKFNPNVFSQPFNSPNCCRTNSKDCLKFHLSLSDLLPQSWTGPVVIKNQNYIKALKDLLASHPSRVVHNSLLLIFTLNILPNGIPSPLTCTKATVN